MAIKKQKLENKKILVDLEKCISCKACISECPLKLYHFKNNTLLLREFADGLCMECGHCVAVCPSNAIILKKLPLEDVKEITNDMRRISYEDLMNLIRIRRTIRNFKNETISEDLWKKLIDAGRYAPTGHNDQLIHFTIIRSPENSKFSEKVNKNFKNFLEAFEDPNKREQLKSSFSKDFMRMMIGWRPILKNILRAFDQGVDSWCWDGELMIFHGPKDAMNLSHDASISATHVMLAAETLGLGTCSLGLAMIAINEFKSIAEFLKLPNKHSVGYMLAIGFPNVKYHRFPARQPAKISWI